jgi:hypothetical protein
VRELQRQLKDRGVNMISEAEESSTGPASFMIIDLMAHEIGVNLGEFLQSLDGSVRSVWSG